MPVTFKPYRRGEPNDHGNVPPFDRYDPDDGYVFNCPQCGYQYVHILDVRLTEGPP